MAPLDTGAASNLFNVGAERLALLGKHHKANAQVTFSFPQLTHYVQLIQRKKTEDW